MTCHYGKESADLRSWLMAMCDGTRCAFDIDNGCDDPMCGTGRVRTLLSTTPVGCDPDYDAAWATLRRACGRMGGRCCPTCSGPIIKPCDKLLRPVHKQVMSVYTATAALAVTALLLKPAAARQLAVRVAAKGTAVPFF